MPTAIITLSQTGLFVVPETANNHYSKHYSIIPTVTPYYFKSVFILVVASGSRLPSTTAGECMDSLRDYCSLFNRCARRCVQRVCYAVCTCTHTHTHHMHASLVRERSRDKRNPGTQRVTACHWLSGADPGEGSRLLIKSCKGSTSYLGTRS